MPPCCPKCHTYDGLTTLIKDRKPTELYCENCGWIGEPDELDEADSGD